jgi:hypothetical protein
VNLDERSRIASSIANGHLVLIARVTGVDDLNNDPSVVVKLYTGHSTDATCDGLASGMGHVAISTGSLTNPSDIESAKFQFTGAITNGRLEIHSMDDNFTVSLPEIGGQHPSVHLHGLRARVSLTATGGTQGNLGGWASGGELVSIACASFPMYCTLVTTLAASVVDLSVNTAATPQALCMMGQTGCHCGEDTSMMGANLGGISMGFGFELASTTVAPMADMGVMPGQCGYSPPSDGGTMSDAATDP